jgi:RNA polymerase sigma-70 factor (ECF subfamily)
MLLESIASGEAAAMHTLYCRHNVRVYRFILRIVRDSTMAEDLVSQVFLDVWRTARHFEGRSQVSTWLLSIARFKALTAMRQRRHEDIDQDDVLEIADPADTPEISIDRADTSAILRACVAKLSPAHREIINLVYYHEKSVEEAGQIIGIPQSTVKTRMFYARKQLAELLRCAGVASLAA